MKVYTKTGDRGTTSLIGGERVSKTDARVEAYGTVDELSAFVALLADRLREAATAPAGAVEDLNRVLSRMMTVEALLAADPTGRKQVPPLPEDAVSWLETRIDAMQAEVPPIDKFTIPGGHAAVWLGRARRAACRRDGRAAARPVAECGADPATRAWRNRLSDYFYVLGRRLTSFYGVQETLWIP